MEGVGDGQVKVEWGEKGPELCGEGNWKGDWGLRLVLYCADAAKKVLVVWLLKYFFNKGFCNLTNRNTFLNVHGVIKKTLIFKQMLGKMLKVSYFAELLRIWCEKT